MVDYENEHENKCIFCKIGSGEIEPMSGGKFYEDDKYVAFLSPFPNTFGFSVIIPKKHFGSDVMQMPDSELTEFILFSKKICARLVEKLPDVGRIGVIMEGTGINHAHIKLFPMNGTGYLKKGEWKQVHSDVNTYFEKYLGYISSNDGPKANEDAIRELAEKLKF